MSHLLDIVALAIVLLCVMYAARALLPRTVLARITGNSATAKKSGACGGCDGGCDISKKTTDSGCH
jgi:hypothetical protein